MLIKQTGVLVYMPKQAPAKEVCWVMPSRNLLMFMTSGLQHQCRPRANGGHFKWKRGHQPTPMEYV